MIDDIKQAIGNLTVLRAQIDSEHAEVMAALHKAHFISFPHRDLIDKQYRDKMDSYDLDLRDMQENLKRLEDKQNENERH